MQVKTRAGRALIELDRVSRLPRVHDPHLPGLEAELGAIHPATRRAGRAGIPSEAPPGEAATQVTVLPAARLPLGATLAAATEGLPEVVMAAFPELLAEAVPQEVASREAASREVADVVVGVLEVASRVEADMVVDGIRRCIGRTD